MLELTLGLPKLEELRQHHHGHKEGDRPKTAPSIAMVEADRGDRRINFAGAGGICRCTLGGAVGGDFGRVEVVKLAELDDAIPTVRIRLPTIILIDLR